MKKDLTLGNSLLAVAPAVLWACSIAIAGPALVVSNDPRGAEVRAAAREFYEKVAAGDAAGAKAMSTLREHATVRMSCNRGPDYARAVKKASAAADVC